VAPALSAARNVASGPDPHRCLDLPVHIGRGFPAMPIAPALRVNATLCNVTPMARGPARPGVRYLSASPAPSECCWGVSRWTPRSRSAFAHPGPGPRSRTTLSRLATPARRTGASMSRIRRSTWSRPSSFRPCGHRPGRRDTAGDDGARRGDAHRGSRGARHQPLTRRRRGGRTRHSPGYTGHTGIREHR
jgi:hypothetical protein